MTDCTSSTVLINIGAQPIRAHVTAECLNAHGLRRDALISTDIFSVLNDWMVNAAIERSSAAIAQEAVLRAMRHPA